MNDQFDRVHRRYGADLSGHGIEIEWDADAKKTSKASSSVLSDEDVIESMESDKEGCALM
jgi:hypothetical protein